MPLNQGKLEKMTIRAFRPLRAGERPEVSDAPEDIYVVQVNPSSYSTSTLLQYSRNQGQGFSTSEATYSKTEPATLEFEFLFDGTGVVPPPSALGDMPLVGAGAATRSGGQRYVVMDEIKKFNRLVRDPNSETHRPNYLQLIWGPLVFPCVLDTLAYRFTLFNPDGTPLRAVATCGFCESIAESLRVPIENFKSPDLTRLREVEEGDTLPLLSDRYYGDAALYLAVARVNKLVNFRRLRPATRVVFPPLDQEAKP